MFPDRILSIYKQIINHGQDLFKKFRQQAPDKVAKTFKFLTKFFLPYVSIGLITLFVFISNFVQSAESSISYIPNDQVNDLNPVEVAKTVTAINPYTPLIEGDAVQVVLSMKDEDYLGKPVITETQNTASDVSGNRKNNIAYTVQSGDTLSTIGWTYGLRIATIKAANNMSSDNIRLGQQLTLPPQDVSANTIATIKKASAAARTAFKGTFNHPVKGWGCLSQPFGHTSYENFHTGIDLTAQCGTVIMASASGTITFTGGGWGGGYGNHIIISHGNGFSTLYGHLSKIMVSKGQYVNQGQQIGVMGSTGWSTGTHLHFEIRKNNSPQNPINYL